MGRGGRGDGYGGWGWGGWGGAEGAQWQHPGGQVGADDALLPQHLGRHLVCQQVRSPASPEGFQSQRQVGDK